MTKNNYSVLGKEDVARAEAAELGPATDKASILNSPAPPGEQAPASAQQ